MEQKTKVVTEKICQKLQRWVKVDPGTGFFGAADETAKLQKS